MPYIIKKFTAIKKIIAGNYKKRGINENEAIPEKNNEKCSSLRGTFSVGSTSVCDSGAYYKAYRAELF